MARLPRNPPKCSLHGCRPPISHTPRTAASSARPDFQKPARNPTSHEHAARLKRGNSRFCLRSHRLFSIGSGVRIVPGGTSWFPTSPVCWSLFKPSRTRLLPVRLRIGHGFGAAVHSSESSPRLCRAVLAKATCCLFLLILTSGTRNNILIDIMAKALTVSPRRLLPFAAGLQLDEHT